MDRFPCLQKYGNVAENVPKNHANENVLKATVA